MNCSSCRHDNQPDDRFCSECGAPLRADCAACGAELKPGGKFCSKCGAAVAERKQSPPVAPVEAPRPVALSGRDDDTPQPLSAPDGERRQLTVLFCDMVGFTELAQKLDPEVLREVIRRYEDACAACITRYEGYVFQRLGDGIVAFFGYPLAHEGEAERAIHAGLAIIESMSTLVVPEVDSLEVRIGIATGVVVVADAQKGAVGEPMNLAARLQGVASPGAIVISERVRRLAGGVFSYADLGLCPLKGIAQPVRAYRVTSAIQGTSRFETASRAGLTPLVGREHEVAMLLERWQLSQEGEGQVVLLSGDPGIGKSRILNSLIEYLNVEGAHALRLQCSPYHVDSAFHPGIEYLERALHFSRDELPASKLRKLETLVVEQNGNPVEDVRFIAAMLAIPGEDAADTRTLTPQKFREETIRAVVDLVTAIARKQPTIMLFEDAHWADPTSLQVLDLLIDRIRAVPLLIVLTHRPEFQSNWSRYGHVTMLSLSKLTRAQSRTMIAKLAHSRPLPAIVIEQILSRTDGVPLFVEELTTAMLESGDLAVVGKEAEQAGVAGRVTIPATLQDSLMARLDRLGTSKETAQLGAALGREFTYELIQQVSTATEPQLQRDLVRLVEAEVLYQQGSVPDARYLFKHALMQDAAYDMLLKSTREQFHRQIATVLEYGFPEYIDAQPELLAHHYTEAGLADQAAHYWQLAGERAIRRSANEEASRHLTKALALIHALPDSPERAERELTLQIASASPLIASKGYAAPEVAAAYGRARALCQHGGERSQLFAVLRGLWVFYAVRCELSVARELGEELLSLAQERQDPALLLEAHHALGQTLFHQGEFVLSWEHSQQGSALYDPRIHHAHVFLYGSDPGIACLFWGALALWFLGQPEQALERAHACVALAHEHDHPLDLAYAHQCVASILQFRRDGRAALRESAATITVSDGQSLPFWSAFGTFIHGWAMSAEGQAREGIAQMRDGIAAWESTGARVWQPYFRGPLAEECWRNGEYAEAATVLQDAWRALEETGEFTYEAELHRLAGELALSSATDEDSAMRAESCFRKSIESAQRQQAKSLELRGAIALARFWRNQGRRDDARQLLAAVYQGFTEGFDSGDLREARALLDALSG